MIQIDQNYIINVDELERRSRKEGKVVVVVLLVDK